MDVIRYNRVVYPGFQAEGNAAQFAIPFAKHLCKGDGYDIGCSKREWAFPGAACIDININNEYNAMNLPHMGVNYIFSSHCLEHLSDWVASLDYWTEALRGHGILFLYLPDYSQEYWRPWNNRKHKHVLDVNVISDYMRDNGYINIFHSGIDLNNSFMIVGEKL